MTADAAVAHRRLKIRALPQLSWHFVPCLEAENRLPLLHSMILEDSRDSVESNSASEKRILPCHRERSWGCHPITLRGAVGPTKAPIGTRNRTGRRSRRHRPNSNLRFVCIPIMASRLTPFWTGQQAGDQAGPTRGQE